MLPEMFLPHVSSDGILVIKKQTIVFIRIYRHRGQISFWLSICRMASRYSLSDRTWNPTTILLSEKVSRTIVCLVIIHYNGDRLLYSWTGGYRKRTNTWRNTGKKSSEGQSCPHYDRVYQIFPGQGCCTWNTGMTAASREIFFQRWLWALNVRIVNRK